MEIKFPPLNIAQQGMLPLRSIAIKLNGSKLKIFNYTKKKNLKTIKIEYFNKVNSY